MDYYQRSAERKRKLMSNVPANIQECLQTKLLSSLSAATGIMVEVMEEARPTMDPVVFKQLEEEEVGNALGMIAARVAARSYDQGMMDAIEVMLEYIEPLEECAPGSKEVN